MQIDLFGRQATGQLVATSGIPSITHAFIPDHLPPKWEWPNDLWPLLLEASKALANLDGTGKHLPNRGLVLKPLQNREAQKSSSLEGTYTDPQEQVLFQLEPRKLASIDDSHSAMQEVLNYSRGGPQNSDNVLRWIRA